MANCNARQTSILAWDIVISGFLQSEGTDNGMVRLWRELRKHASPHRCVELRAWNDNWRDLAKLIASTWNTMGGKTPVVRIYGYSWGGYSATILARELAKRGVPVRAMVLSDAVYRHWYWLGNWRAFAPWKTIRIPSNVEQVFWFRQSRDLPMGHKVRARDPRATTVHPVNSPTRTLSRYIGHTQMDDLAAFHAKCLEVAK